MNPAVLLRRARHRAQLSLRELAARGGTSHSTLSAYESGRKSPSVGTLDRLLRAAGYEAEVGLSPLVGGIDSTDRGRELIEALELAAMFPARHARNMTYPKFPVAT